MAKTTYTLFQENENTGEYLKTKEVLLVMFLGYLCISMGMYYYGAFGYVLGAFYIIFGIHNWVKARYFTMGGSTCVSAGILCIWATVAYPLVMKAIGIIGYLLFWVFYFISLTSD